MGQQLLSGACRWHIAPPAKHDVLSHRVRRRIHRSRRRRCLCAGVHPHTAEVVAKAVDDKTIRIKIRPGELEGTTSLIISSGMGKQARAQQIYNMIQENLGMGK